MQTWEITRTLYKVSDFISWQKSKSLVLSPSFQRRPSWKPSAKSFLIDTVIRGLPMPIIFLREQKTDLTTYEPKREVVDGQQRIRTLITFVDSSLLPDFNPALDEFSIKKSHNPDLAKKTFAKLPLDLQQRILDYQFSVHVLPAGVDDREVLQIFARMNATGLKLNEQELRNAEWFGEFKTSMYELASEQLPRWRKWQLFTEQQIARMDEVELTSEFAVLALNGISALRQLTLDKVYKDNDDEFPGRTEFERRFRTIMDSIDIHFGEDIPVSAFRRKTLFYSLFAFVYDSHFEIGSRLERKRQNALDANAISWVKEAGENIQQGNAPNEVLEATTRRTTNVDSRKRILKYLQTKG